MYPENFPGDPSTGCRFFHGNFSKVLYYQSRQEIADNVSGGNWMKFRWLNFLIAGVVFWAFSGTLFAAKETPAQPNKKVQQGPAGQGLPFNHETAQRGR
jgi:hypothetical protein